MQKNIKILSFFFILSFSLLTCEGKSPNNTLFKLLGVGSDLIPDHLKISLFAVNISEVLKNTSENVIIPLVNEMDTDIKDLKAKTDAYKTDTSTANLTALQNSWKTSKKSLRKVHSLYMGNHNLYFSYIDPSLSSCSFSKTTVDSEISGTTTINLTNIKNFSCTKRGMDTLEYLIFDNGSGDSTNSAINTANSSNTRRTDYIKALGEFFLENSLKYKNEWNGSFLNQFKDGNGFFMSKNDSMSKVAMKIHDTLRSIADYDVGNPGGFRKAPNNTQDLNKLTSKYSNYSLDEVIANIEGIEALFFGTYKSKGETTKSISHYLSKKNESANTRFKNALTNVKNKMKSLKSTKTNMRTVVTDNAARELYDLTKTAKNIAFNEVLPALGGGKLEFETDND